MTSAEYRLALDALPYGKRLPGAVYLIDPGDSSDLREETIGYGPSKESWQAWNRERS